MNFLYPPFDNPKLRRAAFLAMNQKEVLDALIGNPKYYRICGAYFGLRHAARDRCRQRDPGQGQWP